MAASANGGGFLSSFLTCAFVKTAKNPSEALFVLVMYSVASKNIHGLAYFLFRGRYFLPTLFAFCTIYTQLWAEK